MTSIQEGPWWASDAPVAARTPECRAAVNELRDVIGTHLVSRDAELRDDAAPGCLRVRIAGVEVDVALRPTGMTEKRCANPTCPNTFWGAGSGATATRFCSRRCGNLEKSRAWRARHADAPPKVLPRVISRILASNDLQRAHGGGPGFSVESTAEGTEVFAEPPEMLAQCAEVLGRYGYETEARPHTLLVTERKAAVA